MQASKNPDGWIEVEFEGERIRVSPAFARALASNIWMKDRLRLLSLAVNETSGSVTADAGPKE